MHDSMTYLSLLSCSRRFSGSSGRVWSPWVAPFAIDLWIAMSFVERRLKPLPKTFAYEDEASPVRRTRSWTFSDYVPFETWTKKRTKLGPFFLVRGIVGIVLDRIPDAGV